MRRSDSGRARGDNGRQPRQDGGVHGPRPVRSGTQGGRVANFLLPEEREV